MDVEKLKRPSQAPSVLNALMRQACCEYELVSQVRSARLDGESAKGKPDSKAPQGSTHAELTELRRRYVACNCNWDRLKVIKETQQALQRLRGTSTLAKRRGTVAWKQAITNDTRASALVGADFGVSASYVRKLRGQDP